MKPKTKSDFVKLIELITLIEANRKIKLEKLKKEVKSELWN